MLLKNDRKIDGAIGIATLLLVISYYCDLIIVKKISCLLLICLSAISISFLFWDLERKNIGYTEKEVVLLKKYLIPDAFFGVLFFVLDGIVYKNWVKADELLLNVFSLNLKINLDKHFTLLKIVPVIFVGYLSVWIIKSLLKTNAKRITCYLILGGMFEILSLRIKSTNEYSEFFFFLAIFVIGCLIFEMVIDFEICKKINDKIELLVILFCSFILIVTFYCGVDNIYVIYCFITFCIAFCILGETKLNQIFYFKPLTLISKNIVLVLGSSQVLSYLFEVFKISSMWYELLTMMIWGAFVYFCFIIIRIIKFRPIIDITTFVYNNRTQEIVIKGQSFPAVNNVEIFEKNRLVGEMDNQREENNSFFVWHGELADYAKNDSIELRFYYSMKKIKVLLENIKVIEK